MSRFHAHRRIWGSISVFPAGNFLEVAEENSVSVRVTFGKPLPATVTSIEARQTCEPERTPLAPQGQMRTIPESFIEALGGIPAFWRWRTCAAQFEISFGASEDFSARRLRQGWRTNNSGVLLPPSLAARW